MVNLTERSASLARHLRLALDNPNVTPAVIQTIHAEWLGVLLDQSKAMHDELARVAPFGKVPMKERIREWLITTDRAIELLNAEVEARVYGTAG